MPTGRTENSPLTLSFEKFWGWLGSHQNCILRAGTPEVLLFDHEDYHWHLAREDDTLLIVQLVRGKELVGEMVVVASEISYVQCEAGERGREDEFVFECVVEGESAREVAYHFVLAHSYDEGEGEGAEQTGGGGRRSWTH